MNEYTSWCRIALLAAILSLVALQAQAATGLFRAHRTWYGWFHQPPFESTDFHPRAKGPNQAPPASAYVGVSSPAPKFTVPHSVIFDDSKYLKNSLAHGFYSIIESKAWYSYWNLTGIFRPNNPFAATMTTTIRFPTTMGSTGPPLGTGEPVTPTTTFDGRYDVRRAGSIMITPGPNRFGGTMQFFFGPNHRYYEFYCTGTIYLAKAYGGGPATISAGDPSEIGEFVPGRQMDRYRLTSAGYYRAIIGTTPSGGPEYYRMNDQYVYTIAPFTTGRVTVNQPQWNMTTVHTLTGYDNRTPAGLNGVISLVRPRLVHGYRRPYDPGDPISFPWRSSARSWRITFHFLPEPGATAMLIAGVAALACLHRFDRW